MPRGGLLRGSLVRAGLAVAEEVFRRVDANLEIVRRVPDGTRDSGEIAMVVRGRAAPLLTAERTALNFLQRLSGVATLTGRFVDAVVAPRRKFSIPENDSWDAPLEKAAVVSGRGDQSSLGCMIW